VGDGVAAGICIYATVGIKRNRLYSSVANEQKYLYGITTVTDSFSVSVRMGNPLSLVVAKSHLQVIDGVILPEIEFLIGHLLQTPAIELSLFRI
jgi:hypothetical protein